MHHMTITGQSDIPQDITPGSWYLLPRNKWLIRCALVCLALVSFGPSWFGHISNSLDPGVYNDDALQQIWPFLKYRDPRLFQNDYIARYYLDCMPLGYKSLYILVAKVMDPRVFSKLVVYPLYVLFLFFMARIGRRLSGEIGMWVTIFLTLGIYLLLNRMTGGLPRSFALPLIALELMCLLEKRPFLLAVTVIISSLFYPVAAVIGGITLASWLLLLERRNRELPERWGLIKRVAVVFITGTITVACIYSTLHASSQYGNKIGSQSVKDFPELTHGGRYNPTDSYPFDPLWRAVVRPCIQMPMSKTTTWPILEDHANEIFIHKPVTLAHGILWTFWGLGLIVCLIRMWREPVFCRLLMFVLVCLLLYAVSRHIYPTLYMPMRYTSNMMMILLILLLPLAPIALGRWLEKRFHHLHMGKGVAIFLCIVGVLLFGKRGDAKTGYRIDNISHLPVMHFIGELEPDVMIAGWFLNPIDTIPYLENRSVLVSYELHQLFHRSYALEMRERTVAVINAYFPESLDDVTNLRETMGVTHLLVTRSHLKKVPQYFKPYFDYAKQRFPNSQMRQLLAEPLKSTVVYEDDYFILLDLRLIQ